MAASGKSLQKFYKPYLSDEESESDSGSYTSSDSESSSQSGSTNNFTSPPMIPSEKRAKIFKIMGSEINEANLSVPELGTEAITLFNQPKQTYTTTEKKTTVMINSSDRDTLVFPYPTFFSIRLPRVYKNVSGINISQIKLLSSFYYFSDTKGNNYITIKESGREPNEVFIRNGTYTADELTAELNNQLNNAPIFNKISFENFKAKFQSTGDFSLLFNPPSDNTFNNITGVFEKLDGSINTIVSKYFSFSTFNGFYYTDDQILVAYYYPMLKDLTIIQTNAKLEAQKIINPFSQECTQYSYNNIKVYDPIDFAETDPINLSLLNGANYYDRIVYGFQGVDDKYALNIIKKASNKVILDKFKDDNTWKNFLINKYICAYDPQFGRISIQSPSLNTSIVNDLNAKYSTFLTQQYSQYAILDVVNSVEANATNLNGAFIDMYNFIQTKFRDYFGVNYGSLSALFYSDILNTKNKLRIYDALGRYGWDLTYKGNQSSTGIVDNYPDLPVYWPGLASNPIPTKGSLIGDEYSQDDYYIIKNLNFIRYTYSADFLKEKDTDYLALMGGSDSSYGFQDIYNINLEPTTYFLTKFKSKCRQTLFITVIPPLNNNSSEKYYIDKADAPLLHGTGDIMLIDNLNGKFLFFDIRQNMMDGPDYMRSLKSNNTQQYLSFITRTFPTPNNNLFSSDVSVASFNNVLFFRILHGGYSIPLDMNGDITKFKSQIFIERADDLPFGTELDVYWYKDRSAFMADASSYNNSSHYSNPKHYFKNFRINSTISKTSITDLDFISFEASFMIIKAISIEHPVPLRVFVILQDNYGVYTIASGTDLRKLPIDSGLNTKPNPLTLFPSDYPILFDSNKFRNSYDSSGVSNNLLNYIIINRSDTSHYDPYCFTDNASSLNISISRYVFKYNSPATLPVAGTDSWSQFFYNGSNNVIMDISDNSIYYNSNVASNEIVDGTKNEYIFTNWFKAGVETNLFVYHDTHGNLTESQINPLDFREMTILPMLVGNNPFSSFSYGQSNSPFSICYNFESSLIGDISYNHFEVLNNSIINIIGIPFLPPSGNYVSPTKVVIKFSYIQPVNNYSELLSRNGTLKTVDNDTYYYGAYSTQTGKTADSVDLNELNNWDDKYISNRQNIVLGVFFTKDIFRDGNGKTILSEEDLINNVDSNIDISKALCTLSLKKVVQVGEYYTNKTNLNNTRTRSPDWGTYYIYEKNTVANVKYNWVPKNQIHEDSTCTTQWAAVNHPSDINNDILMGLISAETDISEYYNDVSGNSLCFIPFYPVFTEAELHLDQTNVAISKPFEMWQPAYTITNQVLSYNQLGQPFITPVYTNYAEKGHWKVGSFNGLTYTNRPYVPFSSCGDLDYNPNIYFKGVETVESICIEDLSGSGIAFGKLSTYLGNCGPIFIGQNSTNNVVLSSADEHPTFFNIRVNITISNKQYNPIKEIPAKMPNLANCYANTLLFAYNIAVSGDTLKKNIKDIMGGWGLENKENYLTYDDDSGFNYLSFINSFAVEKEQIIGLNLRSYLPTTSLNCGLRITGKNWCDFGTISMSALIDEIDEIVTNITYNDDGTLKDPNNFRIKNNYTYNYTTTLLKFNSLFIGNFKFGIGFNNPTYIGYSVNSTGFKDFMNKFSNLSKSNPDLQKINDSKSVALKQTLNYIKSNYSGILPDSIISRNRYNDPLSFSLLFKSGLKPPYTTLYDRWGLGWNLGFEKVDTLYSTRFLARTFLRIVDEFIYMKLNDEFNANCIDSSDKENLSKSREANGITGGYFGKLLLNAFGNYSQTFVQSAKLMPAIIPKVDQLRFSFVDSRNNKLFNLDSEFNVSVEITEVMEVLDTKSGLIGSLNGSVPKQASNIASNSVINEPNRERPSTLASATGAMNPSSFEVKDLISVTGAINNTDFESHDVATATGKNL